MIGGIIIGWGTVILFIYSFVDNLKYDPSPSIESILLYSIIFLIFGGVAIFSTVAQVMLLKSEKDINRCSNDMRNIFIKNGMKVEGKIIGVEDDRLIVKYFAPYLGEERIIKSVKVKIADIPLTYFVEQMRINSIDVYVLPDTIERAKKLNIDIQKEITSIDFRTWAYVDIIQLEHYLDITKNPIFYDFNIKSFNSYSVK